MHATSFNVRAYRLSQDLKSEEPLHFGVGLETDNKRLVKNRRSLRVRLSCLEAEWSIAASIVSITASWSVRVSRLYQQKHPGIRLG